MRIIKGIVHFLSIVAYIFIVLYGILCIPMLFGYKPLVVLSGSMEPTLKVGDIIYYSKIEETKLKASDIIVFRYNDSYISHRIYSISNGLYETKGDANKIVDARKINYSNIEGKVASVTIPYVGYYVKFVGDNTYLTVIVVVILVSEFLFHNIKTCDINSKEEKINLWKKRKTQRKVGH